MSSEAITRNDLTAILNEALPPNNRLIMERVTVASGLSISANSVLATTQSATVSKSGYSPIGLVGTAANNNSVIIMRAEINSSGTIYMRLSNPTSSAISSVTVYAYVLWQPN